MNIAICDDDTKDLTALATLVSEFKSTFELNVTCFSSAQALYNGHLKEPFDIILLDIEMPTPNGYEIAKQLINTKPKPLIIFITHSMEYSIRGYGVAYRYLVKPATAESLNDVLIPALAEASAKRFIFTINNNSHILPFEDIYYFEVFNHDIVLHTVDSEYSFRDSLKNIISQLPPGYFGLSQQSFIINFSHIKVCTSTDVHLTNGVKLPLSRRKADEFQQMFYKYLGR